MIPQVKKITYEEFLQIDSNTDEHLEYIDGQVFAQASPSIKHQRISRRLSTKFDLYFDGKNCEHFAAPIDIKLKKQNEEYNQKVIPDLVVICDKDGLKENMYEGVPTLIIEIVSPSNSHHDYVRKLNLYERFGVKEYWIVDPRFNSIQINTLNEEQNYEIIGIHKGDETAYSSIFQKLSIDLEYIFS